MAVFKKCAFALLISSASFGEVNFYFDYDFCCGCAQYGQQSCQNVINANDAVFIPGRTLLWEEIQEQFVIEVTDKPALLVFSAFNRQDWQSCGEYPKILLMDSDGETIDRIGDKTQGVCRPELGTQHVLPVGTYYLLTTRWGGSVQYMGDSFECTGDLNHDWSVDFLDLLNVINNWGPC